MNAVILCGGKGTRLAGTLPEGQPKCLAGVGGRPFLYWLLDRLAVYCDRAVLAVGVGARQVERALADYERPTETTARGGVHALEIALSEELEPQGTAGALQLALPLTGADKDDLLLVCNGDTHYEGDLAAFRKWFIWEQAASAELICRPRLGTCQRSGYRLFRGLRPEQLDPARPFPDQLRGQQCRAGGWFLDIGTPPGLAAARAFFEGKAALCS